MRDAQFSTNGLKSSVWQSLAQEHRRAAAERFRIIQIDKRTQNCAGPPSWDGTATNSPTIFGQPPALASSATNPTHEFHGGSQRLPVSHFPPNLCHEILGAKSQLSTRVASSAARSAARGGRCAQAAAGELRAADGVVFGLERQGLAAFTNTSQALAALIYRAACTGSTRAIQPSDDLVFILVVPWTSYAGAQLAYN